MFKVFKFFSNSLKKKLYFFVLFTIFASILEVFGISLIIPIISKISELSNESLINQSYFGKNFINKFDLSLNEFIVYSFCFILIFYLVKNFILGFYYYFLADISHGINLYISNKLYNFYISNDYEYHINKNTSVIIRNLTSESKNVSSYMMSLLGLISDLIMTFCISIFLLTVNPIGTIFVNVIIISLGIIYFKITTRFIKKWANDRQFYEEKKIKNIQESFRNIKEIILRDKKNFFYNLFGIFNKSTIDSSKKISILQSLPRLWLEFFAIISIIFLFLLNLYLQKSYTEIIIIFSIFGMALYRLMPISSRIIQNTHTIKFFKPSIDLIYKEVVEVKDKRNKQNTTTINLNTNFKFTSIAMKKVYFSYSEPKSEKIIFENLNIKIELNSLIGIKGKSGVGKSTFVDLITNILKPTKGDIFVNDFKINELGNLWTDKIGYVTQQPYLLDDSIECNISFGEKIDQLKIDEAIKYSQLEKDISKMTNGTKTIIGESGKNLSGGQIQRLIIARAIYNKKEILILDEPTSSLDDYNKNNFMNFLKQIKNQFTIILISHDKEVIEHCDRIYEIYKNNIHEVLKNND